MNSNPILREIGKKETPSLNTQALQGVKRMMNAVRFAADPQETMNRLMSQNPQLSGVMQALNGRDPKEVFYEECEKHNIDPEAVLSQLR